MKLTELAQCLDMDVVRVIRDSNIESVELCSKVTGLSAITYLEKEKFLSYLEQPGIAAVICTEELLPFIPKHIAGILVTDAPKFAFYCFHNYMASRCLAEERKTATIIGEDAKISENAYIAPCNVKIGKRVTVEPGAIIQEHVTIGNDVYIGANVVLGAKSFNPARYRDTSITLADRGKVVIEDHVEICAQSVVARGVLLEEVTHIGRGAKIDTLTYIAHGVRIGEHAFIASGTGIGGNCQIGNRVWIGVNATISNRIKIGDEARVSLGAVVTKDVQNRQTVSGNFAIEHQKFLRNLKDSL